MTDLKNYKKFVDAVTSEQSKNFTLYINELQKLKSQGCNIERLDMAINGLMSESGETMEILKKLKFQEKPWDDDVRYHLFREAGDIIWYWINLCIALEYDPQEVIDENIRKLESRYPGGKFDGDKSENRVEGDL